MKDLLTHPWIRVLLIATTIAMCSFAIRETASITQPIIQALREVLVPVAVGFAIAYVVTPMVDAISRQGGVRRFFAAGMLFAIVSIATVATTALVVPMVIRQGAALTSRVFQGEHFEDANRNGRHDAGESFEDLNGNRAWDPGLLSSGLVRLEEWQNKIKVKAQLALDENALAFLQVYAADTAAQRDYLTRMLAVARERATVEKWPAVPPDTEVMPIGEARDYGWPSPSGKEIADAQAQLPSELRERWGRLIASADAVLRSRHAALIAALAKARSDSDTDGDVVVAHLHDAWKKPLEAEARSAARAFASALEAADKRAEPEARRLLAELRGGEGTVGSQTLAAVVHQIETAMRSALQESPGRIGDWTKVGMSNIQSWLGFVLDVILVPIYAFFLVLAMPAIRRGVRDNIPVRRRDQTLRIVSDIERVVAAFFRGRLIICTLCSLAAWIGFSLIGTFSAVSVPYSLLFALAIGFATTVPLSGILFLVPALVMTMLQADATAMHATLVLGVYIMVQLLEASLIPTVMGRQVELHPVMLIVALLLCGKLLGVLGLILAVPIAASCRILAREFFWPRLRIWVDRLPPPIDPRAAPGP
ncbi:MAG: AI-2E family transporter [Planctomycetes bacterium]|nr:AI-2E family transporter [Planctomycetota bacterium]